MKVLDYEQVNGDQDKPEEEIIPPRRAHQKPHVLNASHHGLKAHHVPHGSRRPEFSSNSSSYMHGSHIPGRVAQPTLIDENRQVSSQSRLSSEDTIPPQHIPEIDDLNIVDHERKLSLPERMV
jgi:hypothetical protein